LSGDDILDGKGGNDTLDGGVGNDRLFGGAGADRLFGGEGIDIADYTDAASAVVLDLDTGGTAGDAAGDTFDSIEIAVGSNFQDRLQGRAAANDQLFGLAGDDFIFGEGGIDLLVGGSGRDFLDGGEGADLMRGEAGSDTYFVDNAGDVVDEANVNSSSADEIRASISVSLANPGNVLGEVENLTLVGAANINGTGNDLQNQITGNTGANTLDGGGDSDGLSGGAGNDTLLGGTGDDSLDGGSGADIMQGGADNDVYYVDNVGDVVDEAAPGSGGSDIIVSSISFSLANTAAVRGSIEYLVLAEGNSNINGTGNNLDNFIEGNGGANILSGGSGNDTLDGEAGNDRLDGGSGADSMFGGDGDDTYYVDNFGDKVIEANGAGTGMDTVRTTVSYSVVSQFVENVGAFGQRLDQRHRQQPQQHHHRQCRQQRHRWARRH
jgi:Ca2+-binding RTX toxin-like protein